MKVERNKALERKCLDKIKAWLQRRPRSDKGWHVSDLLYPRKTFWRKLKPVPMTDKEALFFVAGHGHHNVLEAMLGPRDKEEKRSDAGEFEKYGIFFSPDLRMKYPIEIKTSRAQKIKADYEDPAEVYEGYLKQETSYQGLLKSVKGALLVLFISVKKGWKNDPQLRFYTVKLSKKELSDRVKWLRAGAKALTEAVKKKKCDKLPLCPTWLCRKDECAWFKQCKPWVVDPKRKG